MTAPAADPSADALDLLIEQEQKLLAVYDARQTSADGKAAAALTAALALATVIPTTAKSLSAENGDIFLNIIFLVVAGTALVALAARVLGGYKHHRGKILSTEGEGAKKARKALWKYPPDGSYPDPDYVRRVALALWRNRAKDSRKLAIRREKWAGGAGGLLALVLLAFSVWLAIYGDWGT
jgi:hypothetical protein